MSFLIGLVVGALAGGSIGALTAFVILSGSHGTTDDDERPDRCQHCAQRRAELDRVSVQKFREGYDAKCRDRRTHDIESQERPQ